MRIPKRAAGAVAAFAGLTALTLGTATQAGAQAHPVAKPAVATSHPAFHGCGYWDDCDWWYGDWGWHGGGWYGDWGW